MEATFIILQMLDPNDVQLAQIRSSLSTPETLEYVEVGKCFYVSCTPKFALKFTTNLKKDNVQHIMTFVQHKTGNYAKSVGLNNGDDQQINNIIG